MADQSIDDKASDTLVVGLRLNALDEEFDPPPSPPNEVNERAETSARFSFYAGLVPSCSRRAATSSLSLASSLAMSTLLSPPGSGPVSSRTCCSSSCGELTRKLARI